MNRFAIGIGMGLLVLFGLQALLVHGLGLSAIKTESNFFTSRARLQRAAAVEQPEIALLGSSITGRLPDSAHGAAGVMNLGADGGSTWDALAGFTQGPFRNPRVVVVEANTLFAGLHGGGAGGGGVQAQLGPAFQAGSTVRLLRADSRPSSVVYQLLLSRRDRALAGSASLPETPPKLVTEKPASVKLANRNKRERERFAEVAEMLCHLAEETRVVVVFFPSGRPDGKTRLAGEPADGRALAAIAGVEFINLEERLADAGLGYTDGVHLDPASARFVVETLRGSLAAGS